MEKVYNYLRVYNDLKKAILSDQYKDGEKLPTEEALQRRYTISRITAKKAMELLAEDGLVERFPGRGSFVIRSERAAENTIHTDISNIPNKIIGVVMSDFGADFGQEFLKGVAAEANRQGCCLMTAVCFSTPEEERELIERLIINGAQGIIAMPVHTSSGMNTGIITQAMNGFPIVLADRYLEGISLPYVGSNHVDGALKATEYLFGLGHKYIGYVSPPPSTTAIAERESGYMRAYAMTKYRVHPEYMVRDIISCLPNNNTSENVRRDLEHMKQFYRDNPSVTALLCIDYPVMKICEAAAHELGIRIPEDLSLVCFDTPSDGFAEYEYTHIGQQEDSIGEKAVQMLLDVIDGNCEPKRVEISTELCIGMSTGKPKG